LEEILGWQVIKKLLQILSVFVSEGSYQHSQHHADTTKHMHNSTHNEAFTN
jgi:hypothetical protein